MVVAVALRNENPVKHEPPTPSRDEVLARYRHLREISKRHHSKALDFLSADALPIDQERERRRRKGAHRHA